MGNLLELEVERGLLDGDRDHQVVEQSVEQGVKGEGPYHYGRGYGQSKIDKIKEKERVMAYAKKVGDVIP